MESKDSDPKNETKSLTKDDTSDITTQVHDLDKKPIQFATHEEGKFTTEPHDKDYMELTLRHGKHSELVQRMLRQRIEARAKDFPRWPGELNAGARVMWIESRFWYDRERLSPDFDDDWRKYRSRYLHSLELDPREPVHVPEYERALINPLRRLAQKPGDMIESALVKVFKLNKYESPVYRITITRVFAAYLTAIGIYYAMRYHNMNWETRDGLVLMGSRTVKLPGHPEFPEKDYKTLDAHHSDCGFPKRTIFKDLRDFEDMGFAR